MFSVTNAMNEMFEKGARGASASNVTLVRTYCGSFFLHKSKWPYLACDSEVNCVGAQSFFPTETIRFAEKFRFEVLFQRGQKMVVFSWLGLSVS